MCGSYEKILYGYDSAGDVVPVAGVVRFRDCNLGI